MNETLRTEDGRPVLRIVRRLGHPPEKVWRAITEPDQLSQWYPFRATAMDLRVGGRISFAGDQGMAMDAVITQLDPPRIFAFSEHAPPEMVRESDDLVRFELRPDGEGCLLAFTHVFDDRPAAASYATGWHGCLGALDQLLDGKPIEWPEVSVERYESYVAAFGLNQGSVDASADGWRVRFDRQLMRQPVDKVWAALNAPGSAAPAVGGPAPRAATTGTVPPGAITAVEEPALLEYGWHSGDAPAGRVRWELSTGPGGARIVLTQTGPGEPADASAAALTAWQAHLDEFVRRLLETEGGEPTR